MLNDYDIIQVAHHMFEQTDYLEPGHCLDCATFCDLQTSQKTIVKAEIHIQRYCWLLFLLRFLTRIIDKLEM